MTAFLLRTLADIEPSNQVSHFQISGDPTTGSGLSGGIGSLATRIDGSNPGSIYRKTGSGATAWVLLDVATNSESSGSIVFTGLLKESATDSITAGVGGTQANAVALTAEINRVGTVTSAGDSVKLPVSVGVGSLSIFVINHGANNLQVFGSGTETINDVAAATGVSQMPGSTVVYTCATPGVWYSESLGQGFSGGFQTLSFAGGLIAHAGGTQGAALPLTAMVSRVVTVGSAGDSVLLPATVANVSIGPITVTNAAATNSMNVFPSTGDAINALGANAAYALAAGKTAVFNSAGAGQWHAILSA